MTIPTIQRPSLPTTIYSPVPLRATRLALLEIEKVVSGWTEAVDQKDLLAGRTFSIDKINGFTDLHNYVFQEEYDKIARLFAQIKLESSDANQCLVKAILQKDAQGLTPLHWAAQLGDRQAIIMMLAFLRDEDKEDCLKAKDNFGRTPFHLAMQNDKGEGVFTILLEALDDRKRAEFLLIYDDNKKTALHYLLDSHSLASIKLTEIFLKVKKPIDRYDLLEASDGEGKTPLHYAAISSDMDLLNDMIDVASAESLYQIDQEGKTLFHYLMIHIPRARRNHRGLKGACLVPEGFERGGLIIDKLLSRMEERGENEVEKYVNIEDKYGNTPLFYAAKYDRDYWPFVMILRRVPANRKEACLTERVDRIDCLIHYLARKKDPDLLIPVLQLLSNEDRKYLVEKRNLMGETILDILMLRKVDEQEIIVDQRGELGYIFSPDCKSDTILQIIRLFSEKDQFSIITNEDERGRNLLRKAQESFDPTILGALIGILLDGITPSYQR